MTLRVQTALCLRASRPPACQPDALPSVCNCELMRTEMSLNEPHVGSALLSVNQFRNRRRAAKMRTPSSSGLCPRRHLIRKDHFLINIFDL